jgi:hypothetical protein
MSHMEPVQWSYVECPIYSLYNASSSTAASASRAFPLPNLLPINLCLQFPKSLLTVFDSVCMDSVHTTNGICDVCRICWALKIAVHCFGYGDKIFKEETTRRDILHSFSDQNEEILDVQNIPRSSRSIGEILERRSLEAWSRSCSGPNVKTSRGR